MGCLRLILAVQIIAVSLTHSLKSSLPRNQTRLLHLVVVPLRCFEIFFLNRTLSLTKSHYSTFAMSMLM